MALLKIGNWKINANGFEGTLAIKEIDSSGNIEGGSTAFSNEIIGFWDEDSRRITFMRVVDKNNPSSFQIYTGYLMNTNTTIAGSFEAFKGPGATAKRSVFGWFATSP